MSKAAENTELTNLIVRKLTGEITNEESDRLDQMLMNPENQRLFAELEKVYTQSAHVRSFGEEEITREWIRLDEVISKTDGNRNRQITWVRVAASVIVLFCISMVAYYFISQPIVVTAESLKTEVLEDGSSITLNAGASISIPRDFNKGNRNINFEGEGFFDVLRDESAPFEVAVNDLTVRVLGTSFNIREDESKTEVTLVTGLVSLSANGTSIALQPGEKGIYSHDSQRLFKVSNDDPNFQSWMTRKFQFEDTPLQGVISHLNNAYGSTLYIENESLMNCPLTVNLENLELEAILEIISNTLNIEIMVTEKGTLLSGSCQ